VNASVPKSEYVRLLVRWLIGGLFIYMGLSKALEPVLFLKLIRQYEMVHQPWLLNSLAAILPWFEVFCGALLVTGVLRRGAALVAVLMLVPFTLLVARRAFAIHAGQGTPFCDIKFDCGCGAGEVVICHKLVENGFLIVGALWLAVRPDGLFRFGRSRPVGDGAPAVAA
jgi:uncharacterized membrane protein YphA (DoxX/SURF4 family)